MSPVKCGNPPSATPTADPNTLAPVVDSIWLMLSFKTLIYSFDTIGLLESTFSLFNLPLSIE